MRTARTAAGTLGASLTFALLSNLQLVATETTIDDSDTEQIDYEGGIWNALTGRPAPIQNGTIHYSNDPNAWYTFNFTGTAFSLFAGKKNDRGKFLVDVDNIFAGQGDGFDADVSDDSADPTALYKVKNLEAAEHRVTVWNSKEVSSDRCHGSQCFLALDYIQYDEAQATTTVSLDSASPDYPSSLQSGVTSNSYGGGEAHQDNGDSSNLSAIIGGAVGGGVALLLFIFAGIVLWLLWRRRRGPFKRPVIGDEEGCPDASRRPNMQQYNDPYPYYNLGSTSTSERQSYMADSFGQRQHQSFNSRHHDHFENEDGQDLHMGSQPPSYDLASGANRTSDQQSPTLQGSQSPPSSPNPTADTMQSAHSQMLQGLLPHGVKSSEGHRAKGTFA